MRHNTYAAIEAGRRDASRPRPRQRAVRPRAPEQANHERWLVSYADFITLLFAVFTTMYALSVVDAGKYSAIAASLQEAFKTALPAGPGAGGDLLVSRGAASQKGVISVAAREVGLHDVRARLQQRLAGAIGSSLVSIEADPRGLVVSIREAGAFAVSSADLSETAQTILAEVGLALSGMGNHVRIEGHTDDVPIHTDRFASNWELSTARATTVVRFLIGRAGMGPERLSAAGYAEYFPRTPNTSDAARARNRRVDLVILSPQTRAAEEPVSPTAQPPRP